MLLLTEGRLRLLAVSRHLSLRGLAHLTVHVARLLRALQIRLVVYVLALCERLAVIRAGLLVGLIGDLALLVVHVLPGLIHGRLAGRHVHGQGSAVASTFTTA